MDSERRVAFYIRISTDIHNQKYSLGAQRDRLETFCRGRFGRNWILSSIYSDTDSGRHTDREGLIALFSDAKQGLFDTAAVFRVDRLSRNLAQLIRMLEELGEYGVSLVSATESFDTDTPAGAMLLQMLGAFAEFESDSFRTRLRIANARKKALGLYPGGPVPYGYRLVGQDVVIAPREAAVVRRVFDLYVNARISLPGIARLLTKEKIPSSRNRPWHASSVSRIIHNRDYLGSIVRHGRPCRGSPQRIIPQEVFAEAQATAKSRVQRAYPYRYTIRNYLLKGVAQCGGCGMTLGAKRAGSQVEVYYRCNGKTHPECLPRWLKGQLLEPAVLCEVEEIFTDHKLVQCVHKHVVDRIEGRRSSMERTKRGLLDQSAGVGLMLQEAMGRFECAKKDTTSAIGELENLSENIRRLGEAARDVDAQARTTRLPGLNPPVIARLLTRLKDSRTGERILESRRLLRLFVDRIVVCRDFSIRVYYSIPESDSVQSHKSSAKARDRIALPPDERGCKMVFLLTYSGVPAKGQCKRQVKVWYGEMADKCSIGRTSLRTAKPGPSAVDLFVEYCRAGLKEKKRLSQEIVAKCSLKPLPTK